ncbi:hypothetical protein SAMN05444487_101131 [Marininema mesophilum]|uniref:Uncharacterized protein n=1 Tax=Marininema mesophilum TaxID=1048340 RepID=A0A1H2Q7D0_9BACL|nr:hypothetical protein [Marininema mesophilum]SDW03092.1 hypothetical protein SAMN05444487_101131 [Marininema mesophilum]
MKKNKIFSVILSLALVFGVGFTALSFPTTASAKIEDAWEDTIITGYNKHTVELSATEGFPYLKVQVINRGADTVTATLRHKDTGRIVMNEKVGSGKIFDFKKNDGIRSGTYEFTFHSEHANLDVYYAGKTSDIKW